MRDWSLNNLDIGTSNYELIGDIVNCVKTPIQNRRGFDYNSYTVTIPRLFYRFVGMKGTESEYYDSLCKLHIELAKYGELYLKVDKGLNREIDIKILNKLDNVWRNVYADDVVDSTEIIEQLDRYELFPKINKSNLHYQMKNNFKGLIEFYIRSNTNLNKSDLKIIINNTIHWLNMYGVKLLKNFDYISINPKIIYYGEISIEEVFFLILMSTIGVDILYYNPKEEATFEQIDKYASFSKEILYSNRGEIKDFPEDTTDRVRTSAYNAKEELNKTLFNEDTGFYRPWQFKDYGLQAITLKTTFEEINIWIKENANMRNEWRIEKGVVYIPNIFAKVSGTQENINDYWKQIDNILKLPNTKFYDKLPIINHVHLEYGKFSDIYPDRPYAEFDTNKLINSHWWRYKELRTGIQQNLAEKIKELCLRPVFYNKENEEYRDFQVEIFSILVNMDLDILKILHNFDYPNEVPKIVVYNNEKNGNLSFEDCVALTLMNYMGVDIIIYNPSGYNDIENYIHSSVYDIHTLSKMQFKLDFKKPSEEKTGFFKKLFGR